MPMEVVLYRNLKGITRTSHHVNVCCEVYLCSMNKGLEGEVQNMLIQLYSSPQDRMLCVDSKKYIMLIFHQIHIKHNLHMISHAQGKYLPVDTNVHSSKPQYKSDMMQITHTHNI